MYDRSINPDTREDYWTEEAQEINWFKKWDKVGPFISNSCTFRSFTNKMRCSMSGSRGQKLTYVTTVWTDM